MDLIPGQGTKITHAAWPQTPQKEKKQLKENLTLIIPELSLQSYSLNVFSE